MIWRRLSLVPLATTAPRMQRDTESAAPERRSASWRPENIVLRSERPLLLVACNRSVASYARIKI